MNTDSEIPATPDWIDEKALFAEFLTRDLVFCDGLGRERIRYNARDWFAANGFDHEEIADLFDNWMLELEEDDNPATTLHWLSQELEQAAFVLERFKETFEEMMHERVIDSHPDDPCAEVYSPALPVTTAARHVQPAHRHRYRRLGAVSSLIQARPVRTGRATSASRGAHGFASVGGRMRASVARVSACAIPIVSSL